MSDLIRFRALQHVVGIRTSSPEVKVHLAELTARLLTPPARCPPDLVYSVERQNNTYTLVCEGDEWAGLQLGDVFAQLERELSRRLAQTTEHALLHAAALARDSQIYLFAGCSGAGKTTLATALVKRGFLFLSDEYAPLSLDNFSVTPLSMPLKLLQTTVRRLPPEPEIVLQPHGFWGKGQPVFSGVPRSGLVQSTSMPLGKLFFPWRRPGARVEMRPVRLATAAGRMMKLMLNARPLGRRAFRLAVDLAESVPCYDLFAGDIDRACTMICELRV